MIIQALRTAYLPFLNRAVAVTQIPFSFCVANNILCIRFGPA
jgi:hypothetical protein